MYELLIRKIKSFFLKAVCFIPFNNLRLIMYGLSGIKIGNNVRISRLAKVHFGTILDDSVEIESNTFVQFVSIGSCSKVEKGSMLIGIKGKQFKIGSQCYIGYNNILDGSGGLVIGDYVHIASPGVGIWTHSSVYKVLSGNKLEDNSNRIEGSVTIENNVWIGGGSIIYPNTTIKHHSVILPNTVVTADIPPFSLVAGNPAKVIKKVVIKNGFFESFCPID